MSSVQELMVSAEEELGSGNGAGAPPAVATQSSSDGDDDLLVWDVAGERVELGLASLTDDERAAIRLVTERGGVGACVWIALRRRELELTYEEFASALAFSYGED